MKRTGNIFESLISTENLMLAFQEARRNKKNYREVKEFEKDIPGNIANLRQLLQSGQWRVFGYRHFRRFDGNKFRVIDWDPYFPDNIVQHAIQQTAGQVLLKSGISDTYAGIRGRGVHRAMKRVRHFLSEYLDLQPIYILKIDIRKFYQSIDNEILKRKIRRKIKDRRVLALYDELIDSHPAGLPIGNYISQALANYYLSDFDHWIKDQRFRHYARYCDDIVVIDSDKDRLRTLLSEIRMRLQTDKLTIKDNAQIFPIERFGIDFVGYVFRRHQTILRKSTERKFRRAARIFIEQPTEKHFQSLSSYYGWIKWLSHGKRLWYSLFDKDLQTLHKEIAKC